MSKLYGYFRTCFCFNSVVTLSNRSFCTSPALSKQDMFIICGLLKICMFLQKLICKSSAVANN